MRAAATVVSLAVLAPAAHAASRVAKVQNLRADRSAFPATLATGPRCRQPRAVSPVPSTLSRRAHRYPAHATLP